MELSVCCECMKESIEDNSIYVCWSEGTVTIEKVDWNITHCPFCGHELSVKLTPRKVE